MRERNLDAISLSNCPKLSDNPRVKTVEYTVTERGPVSIEGQKEVGFSFRLCNLASEAENAPDPFSSQSVPTHKSIRNDSSPAHGPTFSHGRLHSCFHQRKGGQCTRRMTALPRCAGVPSSGRQASSCFLPGKIQTISQSVSCFFCLGLPLLSF